MLNAFFGFSGRMRRRDFVLWSILVPVILILPPVVSVAVMAEDPKTGLFQDMSAAGMLWPFYALILLSTYVSVALYWKRLNDVDEDLQRRMWAGFTRWGYAVISALNAIVVGLNLIALGKIEGTGAGLAIFALWCLACWQRPHHGDNSFGPNPRTPRARPGLDDTSPASLNLEAAMLRAADARQTQAYATLSPKLGRAAAKPSAAPVGQRAFGKRA
jgi:uncharacterized membrane protein YhaH (DUF805 family)